MNFSGDDDVLGETRWKTSMSVAVKRARKLEGESLRNKTVEESGRWREEWPKKGQVTGSFLKVPSSRTIL